MEAEKGKIYKGTISNITNFGAFVEIDSEDSARKISGMIHISEVSKNYVKDIHEHLKVGQEVTVLCLGLNDKNKYSFSIRQAEGQNRDKAAERWPDRTEAEKQDSEKKHGDRPRRPKQKEEDNSFEAMMSRFKRISEDKICDIKRGKERRNNSRRK